MRIVCFLCVSENRGIWPVSSAGRSALMMRLDFSSLSRWAWAPVPLLAAAIAVLWVAGPGPSRESQTVLWIINFLFTGAVSVCIAWLAGRGFLSGGPPGLVMLGCGALAWGLSTLIAVELLDQGGNVVITIHNLGLLGAAACHLAGIMGHAVTPRPPLARRLVPRLARLSSRAPSLSRVLGRLSQPLAGLIAAYAAVIAVLGLLTGAALAGWTPVFFVQGQGGTPIRQVVLLAAIAMFALTATAMLECHRRRGSAFLFWYGLGLALLAVGLAGVMLQSAHGSALSWTGRAAQSLGGAYLLAAALAAVWKTGGWMITWTEIDQARQRGELMAVLGKEPVLRTMVRYGCAVAGVAAAFALQDALSTWGGEKLPTFILFYPAVVVSALFGGRGPGLLATGLTLAVAESWLMSPVPSPSERLSLVLFAGNGGLITLVTEMYRRHRLKAAAALREIEVTRSQQTFAELIERSPFGVYVVDSAFRIAIMNRGSQEGAFRNVRPVIGRDFAEAMRILWPEQIAGEVIGHFRHTLATGEPYRSPRFVNPRADLHVTEAYEWELHRMTLPDGQHGVVCYYYDSTRLRESEASLRESEALLRGVLDGSPDPIFLKDRQSRLLLANPATFAIIGKPAVDCLGKTDEEFWYDPADGRAVMANDQRIMETGQTETVEETVSTPSGPRHFRSTKAPYCDAIGTVIGLIGVSRDITERKQAEVALRESEARFRALVTATSDIVYRMSADWSQMFHLRDQEFIPDTGSSGGGWLENSIFPEDQARVTAAISEAIRTNCVFELEHRIRRVDGSAGWIFSRAIPIQDANGRVLEWFGCASDITARRKAEEALKRSETRFRLLHESLRDPFVQVDMEGRILECNDLYCQMLGYSPEELRQLTYHELTPERWHEFEARIVREQVLPRGFSEVYEKQYRRKDGTVFPIELRTILSRDEQGQPVAMWGMVRDITGRKAAEDALRKARGELEKLVEERTAQWKQTTALAEAERQRFYDVLETLPVYVCLLTPDYRISFANRVFREWFGEFRPEQRCHEFLFGRSQPCDNCETYRVVMTQEPHRWEWTGPNGRTYDTFDFPFTDTNGSPLILEMGVDITEAKLAQSAVKAERQRLYGVLETLPAMISLLSSDHRVVFANRPFRERFGEAKDRHCYEQCFGGSRPCDFCETYDVLTTGKPHHWEVTMPDGTIIAAHDFPFTDVDGTPLILGMNLDITAHRRAEAALKELNETLEQRIAERTTELRESEERLRLLGDNLPDSAVYQYVQEIDGSSRFVYVSAGIERLNGVKAADVLRDPGTLFRQIEPGYHEQLIEAQARSQRELSDFDMELPMRRDDGTVRWMQLHSRPRRLLDGRTLWEGVQTDITGRKRTEDAIKAALAEKEVLLREIHHRVKNNMQVLSSLVSLQCQSLAKEQRRPQEPFGEGETGNDGPSTLHTPSSTLRLRNAFDDLRDRVRSMALVHENLYQTGNFAAVDFVTYARNLLRNLWHAHHCPAAIDLQLALEPVTVPLDQAVPCGLLLNELAINALKHAFHGRQEGIVTVSSRTLDDGRISLRVMDNGVGLPEGLHWQEAPSLGLRLVRMLTQQLRGTVDVRRPEAGGTEFEVTFAAHR